MSAATAGSACLSKINNQAERCVCQNVQRQTDGMANKPWFQANIHAPGTGFALLVIAFCLLIQTIPTAVCVMTPRSGWDPPLSPERVRYCEGG